MQKDEDDSNQATNELMLDNVQYMSHVSPKYKLSNAESITDDNEIDNDLYITTTQKDEDMDIYISFDNDERNNPDENIYAEIAVLPCHKSTPAIEHKNGKDNKKKRLFSLPYRFSIESETTIKQKSKKFFSKILRKKKTNDFCSEPDVENAVIQEIKPKQNNPDKALLNTLNELQIKLQERKLSFKVSLNYYKIVL